MRFYVSKTKPDNGCIFMSTYKPERVEVEDMVDFRFKKHQIATNKLALDGLGVTQFPEPGECIEVHICSETENDKHLKEVFEE